MKRYVSLTTLLCIICNWEETSAFALNIGHRRPRIILQRRNENRHPSLWQTTSEDDSATNKELEDLQSGLQDLLQGRAIDMGNAAALVGTPHDAIGVVAHLPLIVESIRTAVTGQIHPEFYQFAAGSTFLCAMAHGIMSYDVERDYRAPRLAEFKTVYEFSALYLVPFSWLLWRITPLFPVVLEAFDLPACLALTIVTLYGFLYAFYGKKLLQDANTEGYEGILTPSDPDYQAQAQLYLTGNIAINGLACLFLPFAWTLAFRGTEWWDRIQILHPNEAAFLGVSILVATLGDVSGNFLLRMQELQVFRSESAIVVCGISSNLILLLFPEIIFNTLYNSGVSEVGFYRE
jgi:hypothetical protein